MLLKETSYNLINPEEIELYLKAYGNGDARLENLVALSLVRILKKLPEAIDTVSSLPELSPDWLRNKWDGGIVWHRFNPKKSHRLAGKVYQVALWLQSAIEHDLEWLGNVDEFGRPKKLLKLTSFEQIFAEAQVDRQRIADRLRARGREDLKHEEEGRDYAVIMTFDDGYRFVRLLSERALKRESAYMEHCIGSQDYYGSALKDTTRCLYSLRDPDNHPLATVSANRYYICEIGGFRNALPKASTMRYIATLAYQLGVDISWSLAFADGFQKAENWAQHASSEIVPPEQQADD